MRIHEIITEGRDAPLYHSTRMHRALDILETNVLLDKTEALGRTGVSLTRDWRMAWRWADVIFVFDQPKLQSRHRLVPFSFYGTKNEYNRPTYLHQKGPLNGERNTREEYEEFCIGPINNLSTYIDKIFLMGRRYDESEYDELKSLCDKHGIPLIRLPHRPTTITNVIHGSHLEEANIFTYPAYTGSVLWDAPDHGGEVAADDPILIKRRAEGAAYEYAFHNKVTDDQAAHIDMLMSPLTRTIVVYRSMILPKKYLKQLESGFLSGRNKFISTSSSKRIAQKFHPAEKQGYVLLKIYVPAGTPVFYIKKYIRDHEMEILLGRGGNFHLIGRSSDAYVVTYNME